MQKELEIHGQHGRMHELQLFSWLSLVKKTKIRSPVPSKRWNVRELQDLCALLGNIARRSDEKGFLQVGNTVEIVKAEMPNSSPVVRCAVAVSLDYRIHNLQLQKVQEGVSSKDNVLMIMDFDPKEHTFRKVGPGDGDDESEEGSKVMYHDNEVHVDTD